MCCEVCESPIPQKRLEAIPTAKKCVTCQELSGDVPKTRLILDYYGKDGECSEIMFSGDPDPYLSSYLTRSDKCLHFSLKHVTRDGE